MKYKYQLLSTSRLYSVVGAALIIIFKCEGGYDSAWYTKYESYPPYCATPAEMETRKIPQIVDVTGLGTTQLVHATVIIRHGARTPYASNLNCWEGYSTNNETSKWDCNLTTYLGTPPPEKIHQEEGENSTNADKSMFIFEKRYDSLKNPENNLRNELGGTCQLGQLLLQGYEQELTNGKHLRDAYAFSNHSHNRRMNLFDVSKNGVNNVYLWDSLYYRVDDDQRTLMSGQVLLRGLFEPELQQYVQKHKAYPTIPLHTADRHRDVLDPNGAICPRLVEIQEEVKLSADFQAFNNSKEAQTIRVFQKDELKIPDQTRDMDAVDCLMTTMCTDRTLPDVVDDYKGTNSTSDSKEGDLDNGWFQRLIDFNVESYSQINTANDGEFSKLGMAPLWTEIMQFILPFVNESNVDRKIPFALFSGHDSTLLPMLVSLGPRVWDQKHPPYASMIIIEIHKLTDKKSNKTIFKSNHAFRLIYNGQVLTSLIDNCHSDMEFCDATVLVQRAMSIVQSLRNCSLHHSESIQQQDSIEEAESFISTPGGIIVCFLVVFIGCWTGSFCTYNCMSRFQRPNTREYRTGSNTVGEGATFNQPNGLSFSNNYTDDDEFI